VEVTHGFFASRRALHLPRHHGGQKYDPVGYKNVSKVIGTLISKRVATLHELDTVYGVEDAYNLLEVVIVEGHNSMLAQGAK
jgi:hypothetical protein